MTYAGTPGIVTKADNLSMKNVHSTVNQLVIKGEGYIKTLLQELSTIDPTEVDQSRLLSIQTQIQAWNTAVSTLTGLLRAVGDTLAKVTQNIR